MFIGHAAVGFASKAGAPFGPPPPNMTAAAIGALALVVLVPWAVWIDRHREAEDDVP
jgi:hypothetical protein